MAQNAPSQLLRNTDGSIHRGLRVGEAFNPWHEVCGFYPPDVVGRRRDLTNGQKRLYERGVRWAGHNGIFWYGFEKMAEELGKSLRQVKDDMAALEAKGLISHVRRRRNSNVYSFLWHPMFEVQSAALQQVNLEVQHSTLEVQDDVVLEVQPTAQESSQLELCHLNSVKADNKRISGYASQKQRSDARVPVKAEVHALKSETSKADRVSRVFHDSKSTKAWSPVELAEVRRRIVAFWRREPEEGFEVSVMLRARGASAAAVCALLDRKYENSNCRVGGRHGHLPEPPARKPEDQLDPEMMNRGIAAIELPDASRSIVESVRCDRCGGQALVQYTDGTIEGCGCRDRGGRGLDWIPAATALGIRSGSAHRRSASE